MGKIAIAVNKSDNRKIGDAAATYAAVVSCPRSCPFYDNGCYAFPGNSFAGFTTSRLNTAAREQKASALRVAQAEAREIDGLPGGRFLRVHVVGDCRTVAAVRVLREAIERYVERSGNV